MTSAHPARWFDGRSPQAQDCELRWQHGQLELRIAGLVQRSYAGKDLIWPERTRHGRRQIQLPDGGLVDLPDAVAWDRWADSHGLRQGLAVRWAASWRWTLISLGLVLLFGGLMWWQGIPVASDHISRALPSSWEQRIGARALEEVEKQWLKPSRLPIAEQRRIESAVFGMVTMAYAQTQRPSYRLHFRDGGKLVGPNAFALPGGDIVITDALVEMLRDPARTEGAPVVPALLGVIAHELGHVRERHGMRMLIKSSLVGLLTSLWIGDYSVALATVPVWLAQASYSRDAEREADSEALRVMQAAGVDPRAMVYFFKRLQETLPERDGENRWLGLASHPSDSQRVIFFGGAAAR